MVETLADGDGWVTLTETRDPGWRALVDGHRVPISPYLGDFQAVAVPAGVHQVEWRYVPHGWPALLTASAVGFLLLAASLPWRTRGT
jgi:uncharacterized membrane protein YfhO